MFLDKCNSFSTVTHNHMLFLNIFPTYQKTEKKISPMRVRTHTHFVLWNKIITHCNSPIGSSIGALKLVIAKNQIKSTEPSPFKPSAATGSCR